LSSIPQDRNIDYSLRRINTDDEIATGALEESDEKVFELESICTFAEEAYLDYFTVRLRDFVQALNSNRYVLAATANIYCV
jgi:hypothetical protein